MTESSWTLRRFFFGGGDSIDRKGHKALENSDAMEGLKQGLRKEVGKVKWKIVAQELAKEVGKVLDVGIADEVLLGAWKKWDEVLEYGDPAKLPPGQSALVTLRKHSVHSKHKPHVDLLIKEIEVGRLEIELEVALDLEAVQLKIQDGKIWQIRAGSCAGRGNLICRFAGKPVYKLEKKSRKFDLAGAISFEEGVELPTSH